MTTALPHVDLHHPAVDAALASAFALLGVEAVFIGGLTDDEFIFERICGELAGALEGDRMPRADSFCNQLLAGAPPMTSDAGAEPAYADLPVRHRLGITSYLGVPLQVGPGRAGTLCGVDTQSVPFDRRLLTVMRALAGVVEAHLEPTAAPVIRRTGGRWRVGGDTEPELLNAMVLADLLTPTVPAARQAPPAAPVDADETAQLRLTIQQLEHALSARVAVEQAIGVLVERQHVTTRTAFERIRRAARSRGRRVQDLAREIVASATDHAVPLPPELAGRH